MYGIRGEIKERRIEDEEAMEEVHIGEATIIKLEKVKGPFSFFTIWVFFSGGGGGVV